MTQIAFIGIGHMGSPMALNLLGAGHTLAVHDLHPETCSAVRESGARVASSIADAVHTCDAVITMLPVGNNVREVYLGEGGVLASLSKPTLLIDCSTIDVATAREVASIVTEAGHAMLDAPVSGGVGGAEAGTLTFMAGGAETDFERARPLFEAMGKRIVHAGPPGNGQAAKICNNMIAGAALIIVSEAFCLAERLGLDHQILYDVVSSSSGQTWQMNHMCPVPGPVPTSPANNNFAPGFKAALMAKDLRLAQEAANQTRTPTPLGAQAANLYDMLCEQGHGELDCSAIIKLLMPK